MTSANTENKLPNLREFPSILSGAIPVNLKSLDRDKPLAEVLTQVSPYSQKIIEFNKLVEAIYLDRNGDRLTDKNNLLVYESFCLLTDIFDLYWDEFSLKARVVLLSKLADFKEARLRIYPEFLNVVKNIFEKDGHLLEEHRSEIAKFASDIQAHYIPPRTPEATAAGLKKIERFIEHKREIWENMSAEERQISDAQFEMLDEYLKR